MDDRFRLMESDLQYYYPFFCGGWGGGGGDGNYNLLYMIWGTPII